MRHFYKKNQLLQLRGFCALIEEKTIQNAAKKIGTVHSNISLQIQALEKDVNLNLFEKKGKSLVPTETGLEFYIYAKKILTDFENLFQNKAKALKDRNDNLIRIAGHSYAFSHLLPPSFKKLIESNPDVQFELHNVSREEGFQLLEKDLVDFIVFPFAPESYADNTLEIFDFHKCEFSIFFQSGHPLEEISKNKTKIDWVDIFKYDFCTIGKGITAQGFNPENTSRFSLINGTWDIAIGLTKAGLTATGLSYSYAADAGGIEFTKASYLLPNYRFSICYKKNSKNLNQKNNIIKLINFIKQNTINSKNL